MASKAPRLRRATAQRCSTMRRGVWLGLGTACILVISACQSTETATRSNAPSLETQAASFPVNAEIALTTEREGGHVAAAQQFMELFQAEQRVDYLVAVGRNLRYHGASEDGLTVLLKYFDEFETDTSYRLELGKTRIAAGKEDLAIADLEYATANTTGNWEAYSALGIAHDLSENFDAAHEAYEQALILSDATPAVLNNYAISKALAGDIRGAIAFLQDHPRAIRRSAHIRQNLAMFLAIDGDDQTAGELARMDLDDEQAQRNIEFFKEFRRVE